MRFDDHDDQTPGCAEAHNACGATSSLAEQVRRLLDEGIELLWRFYSRPLGGGVRWAVAESSRGFSEFSATLAMRPNYLMDLCKDINGHDGLTPCEAEVVSSIVELANMLQPSEFAHSDERNAVHLPHMESPPSAPIDGYIKRAMPRLHIDAAMGADLRLNQKQYRVALRNISATGAMICGAPPVCKGEAGAVRVGGGQWLNGAVAWSIEDRCGFQFHELLDDAICAALSVRPEAKV